MRSGANRQLVTRWHQYRRTAGEDLYKQSKSMLLWIRRCPGVAGLLRDYFYANHPTAPAATAPNMSERILIAI